MAVQGWANSVLEGHYLAEFILEPNQTNLKKLINAFWITRRL